MHSNDGVLKWIFFGSSALNTAFNVHSCSGISWSEFRLMVNWKGLFIWTATNVGCIDWSRNGKRFSFPTPASKLYLKSTVGIFKQFKTNSLNGVWLLDRVVCSFDDKMILDRWELNLVSLETLSWSRCFKNEFTALDWILKFLQALQCSVLVASRQKKWASLLWSTEAKFHLLHWSDLVYRQTH